MRGRFQLEPFLGLGWNRGSTASLGSGMNPLAQGWVERQNSQSGVCPALDSTPKEEQSSSFPDFMEKNIYWAVSHGPLREPPQSQVVF